jgi:hypothetical protein
MSDNPLKQYFRRPAVYIKLPSDGHGYPPGSIDIPENGEIPIYPMTAIDEITSRTPDALFNGTAVVELIKSCVPNIKDPWKVTNVDLDPLLIAIRAATYGTAMEVETKCQSCEEEAKYDVNLTSLMGTFKPGDYDSILKMNDIQIKFTPMPFTEINKASLAQFEMQKTLQMLIAIEDETERNRQTSEAMKRINDTYQELLTQMVSYIKIPEATVFEKEYIKEFLVNCDKQTYDKIRDYSMELRRSTEIKPLKIKCIHCQHEYEQPFTVNITDFFG